MKRFAKHIILFSLLVVLLSCAADYMISKGLSRTQRGHFHTMNALMNDSLNADLIILGNSRAQQEYNTFILDSILCLNSYNLGLSAQPFYVDYLRYRLYMRHNEPPKIIILNTDFRELRMETHGFEREQYYPYILDSIVRPYLIPYGFTWAERNLPLFRYRGDYKMAGIGIAEFLHLFHDTKGNAYKGFAPLSTPWDSEYIAYYQSIAPVYGECVKEAVMLLDTFLQETQTKNIRVVFSFPPMHKTFRDILDDKATRQAYYSLAEKYKIPIIDNTYYSPASYPSDTIYFHNACHLNKEGANLFTCRLAWQIDSLYHLSHTVVQPAVNVNE